MPNAPQPTNMTPKREQFVWHYVNGDTRGNSAASARAAGYSAKTSNRIASQMMSWYIIKDAVRVATENRNEKFEVTRDLVVERLNTIAERCMQLQPVLDKMGKPTGEYLFNANAAIRANELLGKDIGMFGDKVEQSGEVTIRVKYERKPIAEDD